MRLLAFLMGFMASFAFAQDPVAVNPDIYKVEIENDWVRVLRARQSSHAVTAMHQHPANVVVVLTDFHQRITSADGTVREVTRKPGDVDYFDAAKQAQTEENLLGVPTEAVIIELKPGASRSQAVSLDPVKLDPQHVSVVLENERVRVLRTMKFADGTTVTYQRKAGETAWRDALKHETENLDDHTAVEIQVEIK
jgi:stress response protein YsnF